MKYPVSGQISSPFGWRIHPITKVISFHNGIDIAAPTGTPIYAPMGGTVERVFWSDLGGNSVIIKHDDGTHTTGYAHLDQTFVKVGEKVKYGDVIGTVGNTGRSTGPHLHLTLRVNGTIVDPALHFPLQPKPNDFWGILGKWGKFLSLAVFFVALYFLITHIEKL
jgi:murein DD-endopeptidase MepM/ murein hydrolase activator NlpD